MKTVSLPFFLGFLTATTVAWATTDSDIATAIVRQVKNLPPHSDWNSVQTDKLSHDSMGYTYEFTIDYKEWPAPDEVESDTRSVIRSVLQKVVELQKPSEDQSIWISVCAIQSGLHGETGTPLVRPLRCSNYNSDSDQIEFKPNGNSPPL